MTRPSEYIGVQNDDNGGMTTIGKIVRDAKVFGLIDDNETCEGWNFARMDTLLDKVNKEWDKYGCMFSSLPVELRQRHEKIHGEAMVNAKNAGWSGEDETDDEP